MLNTDDSLTKNSGVVSEGYDRNAVTNLAETLARIREAQDQLNHALQTQKLLIVANQQIVCRHRA